MLKSPGVNRPLSTSNRRWESELTGHHRLISSCRVTSRRGIPNTPRPPASGCSRIDVVRCRLDIRELAIWLCRLSPYVPVLSEISRFTEQSYILASSYPAKCRYVQLSFHSAALHGDHNGHEHPSDYPSHYRRSGRWRTVRTRPLVLSDQIHLIARFYVARAPGHCGLSKCSIA